MSALNTNSKKYHQSFEDFDALQITLASPEQVRAWSHGEVTKAETINYRTYRAEPDGLFCEKIFGPTKNYECYCGKYKKIRYKGIVCDKCGVEVTRREVRRERMGHIELAVPVVHVWFSFSIPNKLAIILDMQQKKLLSVIYYTRYMVVNIEDESQREAKVKEVASQFADAKAQLEKELQSELDAEEEEYQKAVAQLKKEEKNKGKRDFKIQQLTHKKQQAQARIRREYAEKEEELEGFFSKLTRLVKETVVGSVLSEDEYLDLQERDLLFFEAKMGAEAITDLLDKLDLQKEIKRLRKQLRTERSKTKRAAALRRLQYLEGLHKHGIDPKWIVMDVLPVLPPDLRPIISLPGGKFASSDLNDLYRRVINRNNRIKKLIALGAPEVILRNEKRMLQESVDALIDNSHRPSKVMLNNKRLPYKSLTDELKGKKGILRRNLLGKRVDYSARAVIVGESKLRLDQTGLPKHVALEMFKPYVIHELLERELAPNIKVAKEYIETGEPRVWDVLEDVIKDRLVLLNRAPTLHKYGIQAFYPLLVEGDAIRLHPLVCKAFNADFDGDQMAVHLLLTEQAQQEGKEKMLSTENVISIADGSALALPSKDMLLGFYLLTDLNENQKEPIRKFESAAAVKRAFVRGEVKADDRILAKVKGNIEDTSVGRVIFNDLFPEDLPFVNQRIGKSELAVIVDAVIQNYDNDVVVELLDTLMENGFKYATDLGYSFAIEDCKLNFDVKSRIKEVEKKDEQLEENYMNGLLTYEEKVDLSTRMWSDFTDELAQEAWSTLDKNNAVYEMVTSGANGGALQARQVMSIKGLVRKSTGGWVPMPIKGNFRDGLSPFEYFLAANGGRKGLADTALRTATSGYLTRKLVDVAHDVIVRQEDCQYDGPGLEVRADDPRRRSFAKTIELRYAAQDIKDDKGNVIVKANEEISPEQAAKIEDLGIKSVFLRSPITCQSPIGICRKCYGRDLEHKELVEIGKAVGVIAAQSIGEPATQMTLRTFHTGGAAKIDITRGLPRVEELLEARTPKMEAEISHIEGVATLKVEDDGSKTILIKGKKPIHKDYVVSTAKKVAVKDGEKVKVGQLLYIDANEVERQSPVDGVVKLDHGVLSVEGTVDSEEVVHVLPKIDVLIKDGEKVRVGQQLTQGSIDPKILAETAGILEAQRYVLNGVQEVYAEQGIGLDDIHFEVIIRQMAKLGLVIDAGDTDYLIGAPVNQFTAKARNELIREKDGQIALISPKLMGIKVVALKTESFLSAVSFQEQVRVLTEASLTGRTDYLRGMKENVMIGRLIPAGEAARIEDPKSLPEIALPEDLEQMSAGSENVMQSEDVSEPSEE